MTQTNLITTLLFTTVAALAAADPSGHWEGSAEVQGMELKFQVDLAKNGQGELAGTLDNPAQNLKGLPLANIAVDGRSVRFQIKGTPGERAFKGTLSDDGKEISGDYAQGGYSIPFRMTRTGDARFEAAVKSAPIGQELEGVWNATADVDGTQRRLVLTMSNQTDGASTGNIVNVDEGLEIPISAITQKASSLTLDLKAVGASYSGALNREGTELAGTLTQGPRVVPLTFRRSTATEEKK